MENFGKCHIDRLPLLYDSCDAMILPTLLETFSATYPEAMIMRKPIITSKYSFAVDICGKAAEYFDPLDPVDIANKILNVALSHKRQTELIKKGNIRIKNFETPMSRASKYLKICETLML